MLRLTAEKKYQLLFEISQKVRDTLDLDEIMDHLLDTIKTVVDYDAAGIFVLNQDLVHGRHEHPKEMIAGIARRGFDIRHPELDAMLSFGKGIVGYVIESCSSVVVPDVWLDSRYVEGRDQTRSEIAVPILRNDRAIGALNLESDQVSAYDESILEVLDFFADAAAISIEKAMLHKQLLEKEVTDKQLEIARDLQWRLFPSEPPRVSGYDIAGICLPAEEIGGDYFDFIQLPGGRIGTAVADVSGSGIAAAMFMTAFRGLLRTHAHGNFRPSTIIRRINRQLPNFTAESHFVTALYAVLDPVPGELTCVACGHPLPILVHSDGNLGTMIRHGPVLGVFAKADYPAEIISLIPGDVVLLYTDGVVDIMNQEGVAYGIERLAAAIHQYRDLPAAEMIRRIADTAQQFSSSTSYIDDFTLVILKRDS